MKSNTVTPQQGKPKHTSHPTKKPFVVLPIYVVQQLTLDTLWLYVSDVIINLQLSAEFLLL